MFSMLAPQIVLQGIPMKHLALFIGFIALVISIPALFNPKKFREGVEELVHSGNGFFRLGAVVHFLIALLIINTHWTIKFNSNRSIMTVIGYLLALRGVLWMWFPGFSRGMMKKMVRTDTGVYVMGFVGLLFAAGMAYLGFKVY